MPAESLFGDEYGNRDGVGVRKTWVRGVVGYARTEANKSKSADDNDAKDGGDKDGD